VSEHTAVEEQSGTEGLVLGGGGDRLLDREMRQKGLDVCGSHVLGMACVVEEQILVANSREWLPGSPTHLLPWGVLMTIAWSTIAWS
jgi:hypothetical protein